MEGVDYFRPFPELEEEDVFFEELDLEEVFLELEEVDDVDDELEEDVEFTFLLFFLLFSWSWQVSFSRFFFFSLFFPGK